MKKQYREIYKDIRNLNKYLTAVNNVWNRDGGICQLSGATKCELDVHHIIPFNILVRNWLSADKALKEIYFNRIFNEDNMILISRELHNKFHSKYGRTKNAKEDFDFFRKTIKYIPNRDVKVETQILKMAGSKDLEVIIVGHR